MVRYQGVWVVVWRVVMRYWVRERAEERAVGRSEKWRVWGVVRGDRGRRERCDGRRWECGRWGVGVVPVGGRRRAWKDRIFCGVDVVVRERGCGGGRRSGRISRVVVAILREVWVGENPDWFMDGRGSLISNFASFKVTDESCS